MLENDNLLAGSIGGGVYKSSNWGDTWIASNNGLPPYSQGYINAESFCETEPGHIFVGTLWYIYFSTNYGETWTYKSNGLVERTAKCIVKDQNGFLYAGMALGNGIFISTNYGDYWSHFGLNNTVYTLGWDSNSRLNAGVTSNGLYRLNEDSSWTQVYNQGYTPLEVNDLSLTQSGNVLASTQWWGLHYTSNGGELWTRTNYQGNEPNALETINDSIFIAGGNPHAYVSEDTGKTWSATGNFAAWSLCYDPVNLIEYLGTENIVNYVCGIYTTTNFGQNWELLYEFPPLNPNRRIKALLITKTSQVILTSVSCWVPYPGNSGFNRLYKSIDNGQSWVIVYKSVTNAVTQLMEDATSNLYALAQDELLISEDEGNTWIIRNIPSSDCLAADYLGRIYRNAGIGIQYSTDKSITWIAVDNSGLHNWVNDIVINQNNRIYLATTGGVYIGEADSIVVSVEKFEPAKTFYLSQNYPNPFNPVTKIKYSIPSITLRQAQSDISVTLKVYDILGRVVATLVNEEKPAGEYEVEFNGSNLPSGIYFYQLKAGDPSIGSGKAYSETRKMVLLK